MTTAHKETVKEIKTKLTEISKEVSKLKAADLRKDSHKENTPALYDLEALRSGLDYLLKEYKGEL